jgi:glycosyltransferase involved in cell wall biosynthesis
MKLCIVTPNVIKGDGQGRANYEITWEALRRGHHVTLVASNVAPDLQQHPQLRWISIQAKELPTQLLKSRISYLKSAAWLRQHQQEFDLIQVYGAITSIPGNINTIQFVHSAWLRSPAHISRTQRNLYGAYQWLYSALNSHWEKQVLPQAETVIAVSEKIKTELIELIGLPAAKIPVILNGVDLKEFFPGVSDRRIWGLPEQGAIALFVGDIRLNRKNLDSVLSALTAVPNLHLAVVGATERSLYPQMAASLGLEHRVHFLGYRRDVAEIMRAVDFFVFPSRYEACTLALLEALASGLPVITATSAGGSEVVTPDCGIVLSDSEDIVGLTTAMQHFTSNEHLRHQMGKAARQVAEQHSWTSKAQQYVDLFEQSVNKKSRVTIAPEIPTISTVHP